jgi:hypothetical protein
MAAVAALGMAGTVKTTKDLKATRHNWVARRLMLFAVVVTFFGTVGGFVCLAVSYWLYSCSVLILSIKLTRSSSDTSSESSILTCQMRCKMQVANLAYKTGERRTLLDTGVSYRFLDLAKLLFESDIQASPWLKCPTNTYGRCAHRLLSHI